jgi:fermentation-respiration switch protein FrsA (DUF1100 family)
VAILLLRDVPFWQRSWARRICRMLAFTAYLYVGVLLVLLALENFFLFPGSTFAMGWAEPSSELGIVELDLPSADGNTIHAWWTALPHWTPQHGAILYSHGNGSNLSGRQGNLRLWRQHSGKGVLIYDYPGYGKSSGSPTEAGCYAAADAAYDWLTAEKKVPADQIILLGSSLGGAMAVDLAVRRPHRALILINPFTSFPDMAQRAFPWLPARWLVRNRLDNLGKISKCTRPIFITHGTADSVIPFAQGERLFQAAPEPKRFLKRPGDVHNHPVDDSFFQAVLAFLDDTRDR